MAIAPTDNGHRQDTQSRHCSINQMGEETWDAQMEGLLYVSMVRDWIQPATVERWVLRCLQGEEGGGPAKIM